MFAATLSEVGVQNLLARVSFSTGFPLSGYCRTDSRHHTIICQLLSEEAGWNRVHKN